MEPLDQAAKEHYISISVAVLTVERLGIRI